MADRPTTPASVRVAKALSHPLRQRLLFEYGRGPTSPRKLATALGQPLNLVAYHTNELLRHGCIELVRTEPRRGVREHFYRMVTQPDIEDAEWGELPADARDQLVTSALTASWRDSLDAAAHGGFDRPDVHLSRSIIRLDESARAELTRLLRQVVDQALQLNEISAARSGALVSSELVLLHFDRDFDA